MSSHVDDFNTRNKVLTELRQGYRYHKIRKALSKFYRRHFDKVSKYNVGSKDFFCKAFQNLNFIWSWCINSEKNGKNNFPYHFKKIIIRYKKIGYNIDVLRQTASLVVNRVKVGSSAYLFNCTTVVTRAVGDCHPFRVVLGRAYRGLTGWFLFLRNFSVIISVSPHVCFILVLILISMFLK